MTLPVTQDSEWAPVPFFFAVFDGVEKSLNAWRSRKAREKTRFGAGKCSVKICWIFHKTSVADQCPREPGEYLRRRRIRLWRTISNPEYRTMKFVLLHHHELSCCAEIACLQTIKVHSAWILRSIPPDGINSRLLYIIDKCSDLSSENVEDIQ